MSATQLFNVNQDEIEAFWRQVKLTIDQLLGSRDNNQFAADALLSDYRARLEAIDGNLTFHFECDETETGSQIEMIFGCDGFPESISSVLSLVGAAPTLEGVQFKAFNPRYDPVPAIITMGDESCDISDFWFALRNINGALNLEIYMDDVPVSLDMEPRVEAAMMFLDAQIGEYELMTKIHVLDWLELPDVPEDYGLMPMSEFREVFDDMKRQARLVGIVLH